MTHEERAKVILDEIESYTTLALFDREREAITITITDELDAATKDARRDAEMAQRQALEIATALLEWLDNVDEDAPLDKAELLARRIVMKAEAAQ